MKKITVVTICFNSVNIIERTILSVLNQKYTNIEYIIIDGGSIDGTNDIISKYNNKIDVFISEPDKGIFHAMNKGLLYSSGEWVIFMNAGDEFYNENVVVDISEISFDQQTAVVYGKTYVDGKVEDPSELIVLKFGGIMACHQSIFYNRNNCGEELIYRTEFNFCGDIELTRRLYLKQYKFESVDFVVSKYLGGGHSTRISWIARLAKFYYLFKNMGFLGLINGLRHKMRLIH